MTTPIHGPYSTKSRTMQAATFSRPRCVEIREVPIPEPRSRQLRVRLEGCGVCASNIPPWEGRPWFNYPMEPGAPGHEGWGRVDAVGQEVADFEVGDRVAFLSSHAYAQYDVTDAKTAIKLPPALDKFPFPAEPLGCAMNILERSGMPAGEVIAILGIGFLGALLTQLASKAGARVIAVSRRPESLALARQMGAWETYSLEEGEAVVDAVREKTEGHLCPVVVEATGMQRPLDLAAELVAERGRLIIAGYHQDGPRHVNMQLWNWRGMDVINAHERDPRLYMEGMRGAIEAVESGRITPAALYSHRFPLEHLGEAMEMAARRPSNFVKALVLMAP